MDPAATTCLKVVLVSAFVMLAAWLVNHHVSTKGAWMRNPVGRSIVIFAGLIALILLPYTLSLFLHFSRLTSEVAGWIDVLLIGIITPVMLWRIIAFRRVTGILDHCRNGHPVPPLALYCPVCGVEITHNPVPEEAK